MFCHRIYFLSLLLFTTGQDNNSLKWKLPKQCGRTRFDRYRVPRIVNGEKALLGEFPWMARIGFDKCDKIIFSCGGSLISAYYVVTAAHCNFAKGDTVRLGENYVYTDRDCDEFICAPLHQDIKIEKFMQHSSYDPKFLANDYALVELKTPAKFNDFVQPICLPNGPLPREGLTSKSLFVAGWGIINKTVYPKYPEYLMFMVAPLLDSQPCKSIYGEKLLDSQLCIGYTDKRGQDSCNGDSGGPVFNTKTEDGETETYLVGVVSYGLARCGAGPAIYTDVSFYLDWTMKRIEIT